ncbi:MAG: HigA family addiction module antidote protein [Deltaproteobacteria bacterium]|nr:HigA family addiction module antidote protein [Deltaproteobacteria bacterium]
MSKMKRQPTHPGKIIKEDYLIPLSITIKDMSAILGVSRKTLSKIINERGSITPDMALRLSRAFDTSADLWMNLQKNYDLWLAEHTSKEWQGLAEHTSKEWQAVKPISHELIDSHSSY